MEPRKKTLKSTRKRRRLPVVLNDREQARLLAQLHPDSPRNLRTLSMVRLMLNAGLRVSEVVNLDVRDVDWTTGQLTVREGKGGKDRTLWLAQEDLDLLKKWWEEWGRHRRGDGRLFTTRTGQAITTRALRRTVTDLGQAAGLKKTISPHTLRHSFATDFYRQTKDLELLRQALGHESIKTTVIYVSLAAAELEKPMKTLRNGGAL